MHLCSIVPDGDCDGRWFGDDKVSACAWAIDENESGKNLYWTVNRVTPGCNKKPKKSDIISARFAHVDIDPPKGGGPFDKLMTQAELAALSTPPTLIIDSGGGLQAFWRLAGPATLDQVETLNRSLAARLGGDNCHNHDRLMRLAGTINYPNAKKHAAGRIPTLSEVIHDPDRLFH